MPPVWQQSAKENIFAFRSKNKASRLLDDSLNMIDCQILIRGIHILLFYDTVMTVWFLGVGRHHLPLNIHQLYPASGRKLDVFINETLNV